MLKRIFLTCLIFSFLLATLVVSNPAKVSAALPAAGTTTPTTLPKADLVILSVVPHQTVLDTTGCAFSRINSIDITIQNAGAGASGVFEVTASGRAKMFQAVPGLIAGASVTLTYTDLPTDGVNIISVDSTGLVPESNESNNTITFYSPTPPAFCTATPTPIGFKTPTATRTGTQAQPPCTTSGTVYYDHSGGAGMVNVPLMMVANTTGTPSPVAAVTTGPYGQYKTGCLAGKTIYPLLTPFTFSPASMSGITGGTTPSYYSPVGSVAGVPSYTPTSNGALPDLVITSMTSTYAGAACLNNPYIAVVVSNIGAGNAGAFSVSLNTTVQAVASLAAGQQITLSFPLNSVIGASNIATADSTAVISESNESNNSLSAYLAVPGAGPTCTPSAAPDLTVSSITYVGSNPSCMNSPKDNVVISNIGNTNAGTFVVSINGAAYPISDLAAGQSLTLTITAVNTVTVTADSTNLIAESNESNNSASGSLAIPTQAATCTPTSFVTVTVTPTITTTRTPTITPTVSVGCSPVSATITAPFTKDGAGTFCWQSANLGTYINSWNLSSLTINGVAITNTYVPVASYPAKVGGYWYISYNSLVAWGHFEAK